jgi:hypothetical protein
MGLRPLTDIAKDIGESDANVATRAQRRGWVRDPTAKQRMIQLRDEKVLAETEAARSEVIAVTAQMQSTILIGHRKDIARARRLVGLLLDELCQVTENVAVFEELGEILREPDDRGRDKRNDVYRRVLSMTERVSSLNTLATALKTLVLLERQTFGIEGLIEDPEATRPTEAVVKGLDKIMDRFDQVLAMQSPVAPPPPTNLQVIVDVREARDGVSVST